MSALNGLAQEPSDLNPLMQELQSALKNRDFVSATNIADQLDAHVQEHFRAWATRDARNRVDEVLTWLPADTETIAVNQQTFTMTAGPETPFAQPSQMYFVDRLAALDEGRLYRAALQGHTVRLAIATGRNIRDRGKTGTPGLLPYGDFVYFYFLAEPLDRQSMGEPVGSEENYSLWRATAMIDTGDQPVTQKHPFQDETWLALPNSKLLVAAADRKVLTSVLRSIAQGSSSRALPVSLPEWSQVDRRAALWGLRHYSTPGNRQDSTNPKAHSDSKFGQDKTALGVTVQFDSKSDVVEIRYLSGTGELDSAVTPNLGFQVDRSRKGVVRLTSNTQERGPFPLLFGLDMLGFGAY